jgi:kynurenine formamidase
VALESPRPFQASRVADLTHLLRPGFPVYPGTQPPEGFKRETTDFIAQGGFYVNRWELTEHVGTHLDAPAHRFAGADTLEKLPLAKMLLPAAVIDIRDRAARDHDATLTPDDILAWERRHGRLPAGAAVFLNSGWDGRADAGEPFLNRDAAGVMHFPGVSVEAAEFLVREREVALMGVDTLSLDAGPSEDYPAHSTLLGAGVWGAECVANLGAIPPAGAMVFAGAPKVEGASGGPVRLLAIW